VRRDRVRIKWISNIPLPEDYAIYRVHLTAVQQWDNVPTYVVSQGVCVHHDGSEEVVELIAWNQTKIARAIALLRYGQHFKKLFTRWEAPMPKKRFEIVIHDIGAYLPVVKLAYQVTSAYNWSIAQFNFDVDIPTHFKLGNAEFALEWDDWFNNVTREDGYHRNHSKAALTMEQLGHVEKKFFQEQREIRQKLNLWTTLKPLETH
jgi:hypothetical protein